MEQLCWGTGSVRNDDEIRGADSIVGKVIGGNGEEDSAAAKTGRGGENDAEDDDGQEPLALLVVHAAMHMLFLPQFTCDFYEEDPDVSSSGNDGSIMNFGSRRRSRNIETEWDDEAKLTPEQLQAKRKQEAKQAKDDKEMKIEAGLGKTKHVENGILLIAKPASIVWGAGVGVKANQVRMLISS